MLFFQQSSPDAAGAQQQQQQQHQQHQELMKGPHPPSFQAQAQAQAQPQQQPQHHHEQFAVESSDVWKTADECAPPANTDPYYNNSCICSSSGGGGGERQHEEQQEQHEEEQRDEKQMQSHCRCEDGVSLSSMFHDITVFRDFFLAAFSDGKHSVSYKISVKMRLS
jgi:hypothetical protein